MVGARYNGSPFTDVDVRIARMNEAGIDFQVIGPNPLAYFHFIDTKLAVAYCRKHNDSIAAAVRKHPDRLAGLAALPIQSPVDAAEELDRAVRELGLVGAQIGTDAPMSLDSERLNPLYEAFTKLDVPLFIHPGNAGIDGPEGDRNLSRYDLATTIGYAGQETTATATLIFGGVLDRHPKLDVWVSHGGGSIAFMAGRLSAASRKRPWASSELKQDGGFEERLARIWFDNHLHSEGALKLLTDLVGHDRIVFGTNFAGWDQPDSGHKLELPKSYADNARRLLRKLN